MDWNLNIFDLSLRQTKTRLNDAPFFIETLHYLPNEIFHSVPSKENGETQWFH